MSPGVEQPRSKDNASSVGWWVLWRPLCLLKNFKNFNSAWMLTGQNECVWGVMKGKEVLVTSMATAMSGEHSSQALSSWSTFRRTCGRILRSRFSPNFCSFARIFLAGRKFFRSSGSLDSRSKYLQFQEERSVRKLLADGLGTQRTSPPLSLSLYYSWDVSRVVTIFIWGTSFPPQCKVSTDQASLCF